MKFDVVSLSTKSPTSALAVLCSSPAKKDGVPQILSSQAPKEASEWLKTLPKERFSGNEGEMVLVRQTSGPQILLLGLGEAKKLTPESWRRISPALLKFLKSERLKDFRVLCGKGVDAEALVSGLTAGLILSNYNFDTFKEPSKDKFAVEKVEFSVEKPNATLKKLSEENQIIAEATNVARWLGDCPGNFMTPTQLGLESEKLAKGTRMKVTVWDKKRIEKEKMDSFLGVSLGSSQEPRFIVMEYKGGSAQQKPICYVGKGLTFDSGGISLKPGAGMEEMKFDMCGGAAVIATMSAIAQLQLKVNAVAYIPATENMPGPAANKPGDIRKARNGKTIEVNNTDAEGRLILADALVYASEQKPAMILDAATLTGAMMIALGNTHTGFFTRDAKLRKKVEEAAEKCEERVWAMPLIDDHAKDMKGFYADLTNLAPSRNAGSATAAAFLESFVDKEIPWAHFDIAGTAWNVSNRLPYIQGKGASGAIVRTFVEMAKNFKG